MQWLTVGQKGAAFRAQVEAQPGWYWIYRPLNIGPRAYDAERGVVLPVWVGADGRLSSPLTDLQDLSADDLVPADDRAQVRYQSFYCGPITPGPLTSTLVKAPGEAAQGQAPARAGWTWCRTQAPLAHVDAQGIGPIYTVLRDGETWVYPAAFADGAPCDVFELGFAEPLVSEGGIIDASGSVGRTRAEFHGPIEPHPELPGRFPLVSAG